jgi:uncharacterized Ntn-hydrolase superfamily protein
MACRSLLLSALLVPAALAAQQPIVPPVHFQKLAHIYSIGAVTTQSLANTAYGERGLDLVARGAGAEQALREVLATDTMLQDRQIGMVDATGSAASFSGTRTFDWSGGRAGGTVGGRAGGSDKRGMQSAALLVVRKHGGYLGANDRFIDIRVHDAPDPIAERERLLALHRLHFFPSAPGDLTPLSPELVRRLEPILLTEPASQPEKWLERPQGSANRAFLEALRDFMYWENYDVRVRMDGTIDRVVLQDILAKRPGR